MAPIMDSDTGFALLQGVCGLTMDYVKAGLLKALRRAGSGAFLFEFDVQFPFEHLSENGPGMPTRRGPGISG